jgi:hypothetical protein
MWCGNDKKKRDLREWATAAGREHGANRLGKYGSEQESPKESLPRDIENNEPVCGGYCNLKGNYEIMGSPI